MATVQHSPTSKAASSFNLAGWVMDGFVQITPKAPARQFPTLLVDKLLTELRDGCQKKLLVEPQWIEKFCRLLVNSCRITPAPTAPVHKLLADQGLSRADQRRISLSLLRALDAHPQLFDAFANETRSVVWRLLDGTCADIYQERGIDASNQSYEKLIALRGLYSSVVEEFQAALASIGQLASLPVWRRDLMKAVSRPIFVATIPPFVPPSSADKSRLESILTLAADYNSADGLAKLQALEAFRDELEDYSRELRDYPTYFAKELFIPLVAKLSEAVERDLRTSPISAAAQLEIWPSPKKYPLTKGNKVGLRISLRNVGAGHAFNVRLQLTFSNNVFPEYQELLVATVPPQGSSGELEVDCEVLEDAEMVMVSSVAEWVNFDRTDGSSSADFELYAQPVGIDWGALARANPYALEPVNEEDRLVGREDILNRLVSAITQSTSLGSFYIKGQKRVGKTSIVTVLQSLVTGPRCVFLYIDSGDYRDRDASTTITQLGERIVQDIKAADIRLAAVPTADFKGSLVPLVSFLKLADSVAPGTRLVVALDEFDELPIDLLIHTPISDAFYGTIRSLSNRPNLSLLLVGGEKMNVIRNNHGMVLNKFEKIDVDYLTLEHHWPDFQELVRAPIRSWMEVDDDAVRRLHQLCAGNPYFAKVLCAQLYRDMVARRDAYATIREVETALSEVLLKIPAWGFQHFWEDGIVEADLVARELRIQQRRKVLLALADVLRSGRQAQLTLIAEQIRDLDSFDVDRLLTEFCERHVLISDGDVYHCKVPLFELWLREFGVGEIVRTLTHDGAAYERHVAEEKSRVSERELHGLAERWGFYQGKPVGVDRIRDWIEQFPPMEHRLMFQLLEHLRFYSTANIRDKMRDAHIMVKGALAERRIGHIQESGKRKRADILVSYLDGAAKSGAHYAKLYGEVNDIYHDNIVSKDALQSALLARTDVRALVLVDDFLGTGRTIREGLKFLNANCGEEIKKRRIPIVIVLIAGFQQAKEETADLGEQFGLDVEVRLCDALLDSDRCFHQKSLVFQDEQQRTAARKIAYRCGALLERRHPLGRDQSEALVVFDNNCPNNTLPFLWKAAKDWMPLFPRV